MKGFNKPALTAASDMELVDLTRSGTTDAYAELWKRHANAVIIAARCFTGFDPDDIVQETFLRVLQQLQAGRGPQTAFRAYAIMTARNIAVNMARSGSSDEVTGNDESVFEARGVELPDTEGRILGNTFARQVFMSLPPRWQEVLWYRDVEDLPVRELGTYLGLSENATSALLKRAREGFKQAWIAAHLQPMSGLPQDCVWVIEMLPQLTRGKASASVRRKLSHHFDTCKTCSMLAEESRQVQSQLAAALLPAMIGGGAATGYAAWLHTGSPAPASAAAFDPQSMLASQSAGVGHGGSLAAIGAVRAVTAPIGALAAGALVATIAFASGPAVWTGQQAPGDTAALEAAETAQVPNRDEDTRADADGTQKDRKRDKQQTPTDDDASDQNDAGTVSDGGDGSQRDEESGGDDPNSDPDITPVAPPQPPAALAAAAIDGVEIGVFPRLAGVGAPNATISLTIVNEQGQSYAQVVQADAQGRWVFTPTGLMGQLVVNGHQEYVYEGQNVTDPEVVIGQFQVGYGLGIDVQQTGAQQTTIRITGLHTPTKNQVVNVGSTTLGPLATVQPETTAGEVILTVPVARADLGDLHYWQGNTSEGPRRVWWRRL